MKSIGEWRLESGLTEEFDDANFARYMGSRSIKVDRTLEMELRPKVKRIMDMDRFRSLPRDEVLDKMKAVVSQTVAEMSGGKINTRRVAKNLAGDSNPGAEVSRFARMMGSEEMDVDADMRRELKPKIERIMDMEEYKSMPKDELEMQIIAVLTKLVAGISGTSFGVGDLEKRINDPGEEAVAKESSLPSFLGWLEQNEPEQAALSEPQHKQGESNMDLRGVVEKRMMQMAMEIESDGKGSRQEILAAMKDVVDSASKESGPAQQPQPDPPPADAMQADQPPQAPPQQQPV